MHGNWPVFSFTLVVYYKYKEKYIYLAKFKNIRSFPIKLNDIRCYTSQSYSIEKREGESPSFSSGFHPFDVVITDRAQHVIEPFGHTELMLESKFEVDHFSRLIFRMN